MKKLLVLGALVGLLFAFQPAEQALAGDNVSQTCHAYDDFGFSHGTCVALLKGENPPVAICKAYKDLGWLEMFGFKNQGQCIKHFKAFFD